MKKEGKKQLSFEENMEKLEEIVEQLEAGDVPLEKAIQLYKEGMEFSKNCSDTLKQVEEEIHQLTDVDGTTQVDIVQIKIEKDK